MFKEVEEIDRCWVYYLDILGRSDGCYQHHLSLGLGHIRRFAEAKTPEACCSLLSHDTARVGNVFFLDNAFIYSTTSTEMHLKDFGPADEKCLSTSPAIQILTLDRRLFGVGHIIRSALMMLFALLTRNIGGIECMLCGIESGLMI